MAETKKYEFVWSNYQSLLTVEMNIEAARLLKGNVWNDIENIFEVAEDNVVRCFYGSLDIEHDEERGKLFLDDAYFQQFQADIESERKTSWELFSELRYAQFPQLSNEELICLLKKNIVQWQRQISLFRTTQAAPQEALLNAFRKYIDGDDISPYLHSSIPDLTQRELADWIDLIASPYDEQKISEHLYRYPWLVAQHFTREDALDTMKHRYEESKREGVTRTEKSDRILTLDHVQNIPLEAEKIAGKLCWLGWSRLEVKERWAGLDWYLIPLMEELARRCGENIYDLQKYYLSFEMEAALSGKLLSQSEKERRKICFVGYLNHGEVAYLSGAEAEALARKELGGLYRAEAVMELHGTIAHAGYAKGIVRILGANDSVRAKLLREQFRQGEILVTQMTQPNIMDIARKAGAIITDEGGMLSHAAVISREFGIPCIVGTHVATQVLHDGDLVEVDAENGVVRILGK